MDSRTPLRWWSVVAGGGVTPFPGSHVRAGRSRKPEAGSRKPERQRLGPFG